MRVLLTKSGTNQLVAGDDAAEDVIGRVRRGASLYCDVYRARNPYFHRKFMRLLRVAFDNQAFYSSFETFRREVVMRCGYAHVHRHIDGTRSMTPESIAFDEMDEDTFTNLYDEAIRVVTEDFVATGSEALDREVVAQIAEFAG